MLKLYWNNYIYFSISLYRIQNILILYVSPSIAFWYSLWILRLCQYIDWTGLRDKILDLDTLRLTRRLHLEKSSQKKKHAMNMHPWNHNQYRQLVSIKHFSASAKIKRKHAKKQMNQGTSLRILCTLECKRYSTFFLRWHCYTMQRDKVPPLEALQFCHLFQWWHPWDRCQRPENKLIIKTLVWFILQTFVWFLLSRKSMYRTQLAAIGPLGASVGEAGAALWTLSANAFYISTKKIRGKNDWYKTIACTYQ